MKSIIVVNHKTYESQIGDTVLKIQRPSIFGNPYRIGEDGDREEVINKFREYFTVRIANDSNFRHLVNFHKRRFMKNESIKRLVLICCCAPLPCHGDVIKEYLEK